MKAKGIKRNILMISIAFRHPKLGIPPKILAFLTLAYALSPIDLIPDFIPVLGLLDDLVILPVLIFLTLKSIPDDILREARTASETERPILRKKWFFVPVIVAVWILLIFFIVKRILLGLKSS